MGSAVLRWKGWQWCHIIHYVACNDNDDITYLRMLFSLTSAAGGFPVYCSFGTFLPS
jgi:hypothetical protein